MKIVIALAAVFVLAACPREDPAVTDTPAPGMAPAPAPTWDTPMVDTPWVDTPMVRQPGQP